MTNIVVKIRDGVATAKLTGILTNGMVGVPVSFDLGPEWEELTVVAVIRGNDLTFDRPLLGTRQTTVPFEVLEKVGEHIYIGAEGCSASGDLVIQSNMAKVEEPVRQGADPSGDLAMDPTQPFWAELMHEVEELRKGVAERVKTVNGVTPDENGNVNVEGVSAEEKELILSLLRNAAYTADMSATFAQLAELWGIEVPDEPAEPHTHSYTSSVTKDATCDTAGVRTYTCSCGHSYTEAIPAIGHNYVDGTCTKCGAADSDYEDPNAISVRYEMPAETVFDGTNYIDTGVTLIDEDRDWTICLDYTPTAKDGKPFDISNNNTGGIYMKLRGGYFWNVCVVSSYVDISTAIENMKVVLTHTAGSANVNVAYVTASKELSSHVFTNYEQNTANIWASKNIILGADYTKANNFAQGTMHRFVVYNGVLDDAAINEFLGVSA